MKIVIHNDNNITDNNDEFIDKMIEQRKNHFIFYNMTNILINTNLIEELEETEIDKRFILLGKCHFCSQCRMVGDSDWSCEQPLNIT